MKKNEEINQLFHKHTSGRGRLFIQEGGSFLGRREEELKIIFYMPVLYLQAYRKRTRSGTI
jgi:hypothetical protein